VALNIIWRLGELYWSLLLMSLIIGLSAVKFIRDQAEAAVATTLHNDANKPKGPASSAQAAAHALRRILTGDGGSNIAVHVAKDHLPQAPDAMDPLSGWSDGISLRKSHFCLLLKPQIVLQSKTNVDSVCVLAAVQAKLQSFAIMDDSNVEDPISGKIMSRYALLLFSEGIPTRSCTQELYVVEWFANIFPHEF
jgi:hypothetical protein